MEAEKLFAHIPRNLPDELCEVIGGNIQVRIERIVSRGHCSEPGFWYDEDEFAFLLRGVLEQHNLKGEDC